MSTDNLIAVLFSIISALSCSPGPGPVSPDPDTEVKVASTSPAVVCEIERTENAVVAYAKATEPVSVKYSMDLTASGSGNEATISRGGKSNLKAGERQQLKEVNLKGYSSISGEVSINWKGGETSCVLG